MITNTKRILAGKPKCKIMCGFFLIKINRKKYDSTMLNEFIGLNTGNDGWLL